MGKPRADDYEDEETPVEALHGNAQPAGQSDAIGDLLLDLATNTARAGLMLRELDADGFAHVQPRLLSFLRFVDGLPKAGRERRRVGFAVEPKAKRKGRK